MPIRYFTPNEVLLHNKETDLWVSLLGQVYNLTELVKENKGSELLKPLLAFAGKDISHWFDPDTMTVKVHVDIESGLVRSYCPHGRFLHVAPSYPSNDWATDFGIPWWKNMKYIIGRLSKQVRKLRIINALTSTENLIEVCGEESIDQIVDRYLPFNAHARSYTWKYGGKPLDMMKTLAENDIRNDALDFYEVGISEDYYYPAILICYDDDLTVMLSIPYPESSKIRNLLSADMTSQVKNSTSGLL